MRWLACVLVLAAGCAAEQPAKVCPWLTLGTASRLLGAAATVRVQVAEDGTGSCVFLAAPKSAMHAAAEVNTAASLTLTVAAHAQPSCGRDAKALSGVGNQAQECGLQGKSRRESEAAVRIVGQVRDRWFVLDAVGLPESSERNPPARWADEAGLPTPLERAAEQVAGNLY